MKTSHILAMAVASALCLSACRSHRQVVVEPAPALRVVGDGRVVVERPTGSKSKGSNDISVSQRLVRNALGWVGTPYVYGGQSRKGTDCSGMVMVIYQEETGIKLPRNSAEQQRYCLSIDRAKLEPGDLVFFSSSKGGKRVSHVGMYIGDNRMVHASTSRGVMVSGLGEPYFVSHFHSAGRVEGITYAARGTRRDDEVVEPVPGAVRDSKPRTAVTHTITLDQFIAATDSLAADSLRCTVDSAVVIREVHVDSLAAAIPNLVPNAAAKDSLQKSAEIRSTVNRAMNFGKK